MEVETWWPGEHIILEICGWLSRDFSSLGALYKANKSWREVILYFVMKTKIFHILIHNYQNRRLEFNDYFHVYTEESAFGWRSGEQRLKVPEGMGRILILFGKLRRYFSMKIDASIKVVGGFLFCIPSEAMSLELYRLALICQGYVSYSLPPICSIDVLDIENKKKRKEQYQ